MGSVAILLYCYIVIIVISHQYCNSCCIILLYQQCCCIISIYQINIVIILYDYIIFVGNLKSVKLLFPFGYSTQQQKYFIFCIEW